MIPASHCLIAATQSQINIVGVSLLQISDGHASTLKMLYICVNIHEAHLFETAQIDLGIIPRDFLHSTAQITPIRDVSAPPTTLASSGCPLRQDPHPLPTILPFSVNQNNTAEYGYHRHGSCNIINPQRSIPVSTSDCQQWLPAPWTRTSTLMLSLKSITPCYQFRIPGNRKWKKRWTWMCASTQLSKSPKAPYHLVLWNGCCTKEEW